MRKLTQEELDEMNRRSDANKYSLLGNIGEYGTDMAKDALKMFVTDPAQAAGQAAGIVYGAATNEDMGLEDMWNLLDEEEKATIMAEGAGAALAPVGGKLLSKYGHVPVKEMALGVRNLFKAADDGVTAVTKKGGELIHLDDVKDVLDGEVPVFVNTSADVESKLYNDAVEKAKKLAAQKEDEKVFKFPDDRETDELFTSRLNDGDQADLDVLVDEVIKPTKPLSPDEKAGMKEIIEGLTGLLNRPKGSSPRDIQDVVDAALKEASELRATGFLEEADKVESDIIKTFRAHLPEASPAQVKKWAEVDAKNAEIAAKKVTERGDELSQLRDSRASLDQTLKPANNRGALSMDEFASTLDDQPPAVQSEFLSRYKEIQDATLEEEELLGLTAKKIDRDHPAFEAQAEKDHKQAEEALQAKIDDMLAFIRDNNK